MKQWQVFILGMWEFRSSVTTHVSDDDQNLIDAYDWGREWAHRLTFRKFESD